MRLLMTLLVALIASASAAQAQKLPGPANAGWYVLTGEFPTSSGCQAVIIAADELSNYTPPTHSPTGRQLKTPVKHGPFNSRSDAVAALIQSGWKFFSDQFGYVADTGC